MKSKILGLLACVLTMPAMATTITYSAALSGAEEEPANASPGTGTATVTVDTTASTMQVDVTFQDLVGTTTVAHIHCCTSAANTGTAAVATVTPLFPGFPVGVTAGSYSMLFDMTLANSFNASFIAANGGTTVGAWNALLFGFDAGTTYFNLHTAVYPGGEIRGFLQSVSVPEPGTLALLGLGLAGLSFGKRSKKA